MFNFAAINHLRAEVLGQKQWMAKFWCAIIKCARNVHGDLLSCSALYVSLNTGLQAKDYMAQQLIIAPPKSHHHWNVKKKGGGASSQYKGKATSVLELKFVKFYIQLLLNVYTFYEDLILQHSLLFKLLRTKSILCCIVHLRSNLLPDIRTTGQNPEPAQPTSHPYILFP